MNIETVNILLDDTLLCHKENAQHEAKICWTNPIYQKMMV